MTQTEYIEKIRKNIKASSNEIEDNDLIIALNNALSEMSRDVPLIKMVKYDTNENMKYSLPADWEEGFSFIQCVESEDMDTSEYLEESDYKISIIDGNSYLEITKDKIEARVIKLHYSIQYKVDEEGNNVRGSLTSALVWIACSLSLFILAQKYSYLTDSAFNTDLNSKSRSEKFLELSNKYKSMYEDLISKIIFGGSFSRAYLTTRSHSSDVFGSNKMFH